MLIKSFKKGKDFVSVAVSRVKLFHGLLKRHFRPICGWRERERERLLLCVSVMMVDDY